MLTIERLVEVQLLLLAANGAPVLAARLLGERFAWPVDAGRRLRDGRPLFGTSKTWRGIAAGVAATTLMALLLGHEAGLGFAFGVASLAGDLGSSFLKRRLGLPSSARALGLDQVPEALLPLLVSAHALALDGWSMLILVLVFTFGSLILSRVMYRLGIRKHPY